MRRGAVAILTLNPQVIGGAAVSTGAASPSADAAAATTAAGAGGGNGSRVVADAWHHQMVYGVTHEGVHLTNPHSLLTWPSLSAQLCSESVLLVRKADVCKVWTNNDDLTPLANQPDPRWTSMNVLGQVRVGAECLAFSRVLCYTQSSQADTEF
uniref:TFIIIC_delta domain-containing protein n=1 Tax=Macrostomum lignano TaxID=282301 RepID=A0A1I8G6N8_9PLAT